MITLQDFKEASFEKKCDLITGYTDYMTVRKTGDAKVYLYHTGKFFIEVYYSPAYKRVLLIHAFNDTASLEPYAEDVSLADLKL